MRRKLPLDPFDPKTPFREDFQIGKTCSAIVFLGALIGCALIVSSDFGTISGLLMAAVGLVMVAGSIGIAIKGLRSI